MRASEARKTEQALAQSEEARQELQLALRSEQIKAKLAEEGLTQLDRQLTLQEQAIGKIETWKAHSEKRMTAVVEQGRTTGQFREQSQEHGSFQI